MTDDISVFVINLESDVARRADIVAGFSGLPGFSLHVVPAVAGALLADAVSEALVGDPEWSQRKGTIGCFLSHVEAWERVARLGRGFAVVMEDDVDIAELGRLHDVRIPDDGEIVFLNDRMSVGPAPPGHAGIAPDVLPLRHALRKLDQIRSGPGGDGYLLTAHGAEKLLAACRADLFYGHVDGRLLRYATTRDELAAIGEDSWIGNVLCRHHHPDLMPELGLLKGYCLSFPLVSHKGLSSSRETEDAVRRDARAPATIPATAPAAPRPARDQRDGQRGTGSGTGRRAPGSRCATGTASPTSAT